MYIYNLICTLSLFLSQTVVYGTFLQSLRAQCGRILRRNGKPIANTYPNHVFYYPKLSAKNTHAKYIRHNAYNNKQTVNIFIWHIITHILVCSKKIFLCSPSATAQHISLYKYNVDFISQIGQCVSNDDRVQITHLYMCMHVVYIVYVYDVETDSLFATIDSDSINFNTIGLNFKFKTQQSEEKFKLFDVYFMCT